MSLSKSHKYAHGEDVEEQERSKYRRHHRDRRSTEKRQHHHRSHHTSDEEDSSSSGESDDDMARKYVITPKEFAEMESFFDGKPSPPKRHYQKKSKEVHEAYEHAADCKCHSCEKHEAPYGKPAADCPDECWKGRKDKLPQSAEDDEEEEEGSDSGDVTEIIKNAVTTTPFPLKKSRKQEQPRRRRISFPIHLPGLPPLIEDEETQVFGGLDTLIELPPLPTVSVSGGGDFSSSSSSSAVVGTIVSLPSMELIAPPLPSSTPVAAVPQQEEAPNAPKRKTKFRSKYLRALEDTPPQQQDTVEGEDKKEEEKTNNENKEESKKEEETPAEDVEMKQAADLAPSSSSSSSASAETKGKKGSKKGKGQKRGREDEEDRWMIVDADGQVVCKPTRGDSIGFKQRAAAVDAFIKRTASIEVEDGATAAERLETIEKEGYSAVCQKVPMDPEVAAKQEKKKAIRKAKRDAKKAEIAAAKEAQAAADATESEAESAEEKEEAQPKPRRNKKTTTPVAPTMAAMRKINKKGKKGKAK